MRLDDLTWIDGYVRGDETMRQAIMLGHFDGRSAREVERETGLPKSSVQRMLAEFRPAYESWRDRKWRLGEVVNETEGYVPAHAGTN